VIHFLFAKNTAPVDIHSQLCEVYGEKCMSIQHVRKWCREFKDGRTDVHDKQHSGRPSVSDETIAKVEETMLKDRRVTARELCEMIPDVSKTCIATFAARLESSMIQA
jgi:transposase